MPTRRLTPCSTLVPGTSHLSSMTDKLAFVGLQEDAIDAGGLEKGAMGTAGSELGCRRSAPQTWNGLGVWMDIFWTETWVDVGRL